MNKDLYWVWLSAGLGAGAKTLELLSYYEWDPYEIYCASEQELWELRAVSENAVKRLKSYTLQKAQDVLDATLKNGWKLITPQNENYPKRLLCLDDLPVVLFVNGDETLLNYEMTLSVVGGREASDYGRAIAKALSGALASRGFLIVSGGALGIDSAAHAGALDEKGKTICVLGCGLGTRYLMYNEPMRQKIAETGAVISEFPPFTPASITTFPIRNRIISGLSLGTIAVEAGEKSGSLITARLASEQGRDVFAVPGDLVESSNLGTNNLIRNGAVPVFSPNDILEEYCNRFIDKLNNDTRPPDDEIIRRAQVFLTNEAFLKEGQEMRSMSKKRSGSKGKKKPEPKPAKNPAPSYLTENAVILYDLIGDEPMHVDEIINICKMTAGDTLSALTELEIYGLIAQLSGRRYKMN